MKTLLFIFLILVCVKANAEDTTSPKFSVRELKEHPRLLVSKEQLQGLSDATKQTDHQKKIMLNIIKQAEDITKEEVLVYQKKGKRLLTVSRNAIHRILICTVSYYCTNNKKFSERAIKEMLAVSVFKDWNPSHFLDVAEMTTALAFGYDWLYDVLTKEEKNIIEKAILEKRIMASLKVTGWVNSKNNWGQVCHGGITLGALAIYDSAPKQAEEVIKRSQEKIKISMGEYRENGAFPEGPSYWAYGTTYNTLYFCALESALKISFEPEKHQTFIKSANYIKHLTGPTQQYFNYSDGSVNRLPNWINYWFAKQLKDSDLLSSENEILKAYLENDSNQTNRFFALTPFFYLENTAIEQKQSSFLSFIDNGQNPIACHRNSWADNNTAFVAIKGGSPSANHGHMDIGSFIFELDGVRWAEDLGSADYNMLESKGLNIWDKNQNSDRWKIFRYHNKSHNTLMINNNGQNVKNKSIFTSHYSTHEKKFSIINMQPSYQGQLKVANRGFLLTPEETLVIQDEVALAEMESELRWSFLTRAEVNIDGSKAILKMKNKEICVQILEPNQVKFEFYEAENPGNHWDQENKGAKMLGFTLTLKGNEVNRIVVQFSKKDKQNSKEKIIPLKDWDKKE